MLVKLDEQGYVESYAIEGSLTDGIEVETPGNLRYFTETPNAYKVVEGKVVRNTDKVKELQNEANLEILRQQREEVCFSVINRGQLWYDSLTRQQYEELNDWYQAWLIVTDTLTIPDKPIWL